MVARGGAAAVGGWGGPLESAVEAGLVRAGRLRQSVLRSALRGGCDDVRNCRKPLWQGE